MAVNICRLMVDRATSVTISDTSTPTESVSFSLMFMCCCISFIKYYNVVTCINIVWGTGKVPYVQLPFHVGR